MVERYKVCRCVYYIHAVDACPSYGSRGHESRTEEVLVGSSCARHSGTADISGIQGILLFPPPETLFLPITQLKEDTVSGGAAKSPADGFVNGTKNLSSKLVMEHNTSDHTLSSLPSKECIKRTNTRTSPLSQEENYVRALYDYNAERSADLSFHQGDIIQVISMLDDGWWDGILHGVRGTFPSNFCSNTMCITPIEHTYRIQGSSAKADSKFLDVSEPAINDETALPLSDIKAVKTQTGEEPHLFLRKRTKTGCLSKL